MHDPNQPDGKDELLDRAIASLREMPAPPGPSPFLEQRTLESIREKQRRYWKWYSVSVAAVAILLLAIGIPLVRYVHRQATEQKNELIGLHKINTPAPPTDPKPQPASHPSEVPKPSPPKAVVASDVSIEGHVYFRGPHPERLRINLSSCPQCAEVVHGPLYDDSLVVGKDGALANVVVSISGGLPPGEQFPVSQSPVMLDQKGCMFHPHVIASMVGQPIVVRNSDPFLHSVHSMDAEMSPAFDFAQPAVGERQIEPLRVVETFQVKCDLHPWMCAWVRVFDHPYFAVTAADGSFALPPLPPGTYRVKAWQEVLGVVEKQIRIVAGHSTNVSITFDGR